MAKFCVGVVYRGLSNYVVEAKDEDEARELARKAFENADDPYPTGNEYEELVKIGDVLELDEEIELVTPP